MNINLYAINEAHFQPESSTSTFRLRYNPHNLSFDKICSVPHPLYSDIFLDHFQNPRNVGELPPPAITVEVSNPVCGDILRLSAHFDNGILAAAAYKARGCTASIAAGSALTEWMLGKSHQEIAAVTANAIDEAVGGLIPESKHVAVLCVDAAKKLCSTAR